MSISRFERATIVAELNESIVEVARRMRDFRVGCVVVTRGARVVGILTDRDVVIRVIAEGRNPEHTVVADVVTYDPATLQRTDGIETALQLMRERGVRRLPIVSYDGKVTGIVTADDLTALLARELSTLGAGISENVDTSACSSTVRWTNTPATWTGVDEQRGP